MRRHRRIWIPALAALLALALVATSVGARPPQPGNATGEPGSLHDRIGESIGSPSAPIIGPTSWADSFDDGLGLSWLENTQQIDSQVSLNPSELLCDGLRYMVQSLSEGPDGVFYMGTSEARLWSCDPATGHAKDLGPPVPDECNN